MNKKVLLGLGAVAVVGVGSLVWSKVRKNDKEDSKEETKETEIDVEDATECFYESKDSILKSVDLLDEEQLKEFNAINAELDNDEIDIIEAFKRMHVIYTAWFDKYMTTQDEETKVSYEDEEKSMKPIYEDMRLAIFTDIQLLHTDLYNKYMDITSSYDTNEINIMEAFAKMSSVYQKYLEVKEKHDAEVAKQAQEPEVTEEAVKEEPAKEVKKAAKPKSQTKKQPQKKSSPKVKAAKKENPVEETPTVEPENTESKEETTETN